MSIPSTGLSTNTRLTQIANNSSSILEITSMLFEGHVVRFLAFLTEMTQNFDSTWNSEDVFGRNDPIAIFQGTKRTISLAFNVVADKQSEAVLNLTNLDILTSFLYPAYKNNFVNQNRDWDPDEDVGPPPPDWNVASNMHGAPLVKIRFANLINGENGNGLLGYITGFSMSQNTDTGTFTSGGRHYPKVWEISFTLNVLHQQTPGWKVVGTDGEWIRDNHFFGNKKVPGDPNKNIHGPPVPDDLNTNEEPNDPNPDTPPGDGGGLGANPMQDADVGEDEDTSMEFDPMIIIADDPDPLIG